MLSKGLLQNFRWFTNIYACITGLPCKFDGNKQQLYSTPRLLLCFRLQSLVTFFGELYILLQCFRLKFFGGTIDEVNFTYAVTIGLGVVLLSLALFHLYLKEVIQYFNGFLEFQRFLQSKQKTMYKK